MKQIPLMYQKGVMQMKIEQEETKSQGMGIVALGVICTALAILFVFLIARTSTHMAEKEAILSSQAEEIAALESEVSALAADRETDETEETQKEAPRSETDLAIAEGFLRTLLTFDDYAGYQEVRAYAKETLGAADTDLLLTSFLPDLPEGTFGETEMEFLDGDVYTLSEEGDVISYFALCSVSNGTKGRGKIGVEFQINGAGQISKVSAYTLVR